MIKKEETGRLNGGMKTLFGLFVIWLCLYLVAMAQDISSRGAGVGQPETGSAEQVRSGVEATGEKQE